MLREPRTPRRAQRHSLTPTTTAVALRPSDGITPTPKERHSGTTEEEAEQRQRPLHAGLTPKQEETQKTGGWCARAASFRTGPRIFLAPIDTTLDEVDANAQSLHTCSKTLA